MRACRPPHLLQVLFFCLLAACAGTGDDATLDPTGGKADDLGANCADTHLDSHGFCRHANGTFAPRACCEMSPLQQLASRLQEDGVVVMPPPGVEFNASELSTEVRVVDVPDPDRPGDVIAPLATAIAAEPPGTPRTSRRTTSAPRSSGATCSSSPRSAAARRSS